MSESQKQTLQSMLMKLSDCRRKKVTLKKEANFYFTSLRVRSQYPELLSTLDLPYDCAIVEAYESLAISLSEEFQSGIGRESIKLIDEIACNHISKVDRLAACGKLVPGESSIVIVDGTSFIDIINDEVVMTNVVAIGLKS